MKMNFPKTEISRHLFSLLSFITFCIIFLPFPLLVNIMKRRWYWNKIVLNQQNSPSTK